MKLTSVPMDASLLSRMLVMAATMAGADRGELLKAAGLSEGEMSDLAVRLPSLYAERIMDSAVQLTGNDNMGLTVGEMFRSIGGDTIVSYVFMSAPTLRLGILRSSEYQRLMTDLGYSELQEEAAVSRLVLRTREERAVWPRQLSEWALCAFWLQLQKYGGAAVRLSEVHFQHSAPTSTREHERVFGCLPRFSMPDNQLLFASEMLDLGGAIAEVDPNLHAFLVEQANRQLALVGPSDDFVGQVRHALVQTIGSGQASVEGIASLLSMTARTLQRRLREHGTTYQQQATDVRKTLCRSYLRDTDISLEDVAFLSGFQSREALHRAVRRWFGATPAQMRRSAKSGAES